MLNSKTRYRNVPPRFPPPSLNHRTLTAGLFAALWAVPAQAVTYVEQGRLHDAASWHNDEFKREWGLAAIGADHAYARGLSGLDVRLGIFDSGTDLRHPQFAGKNHKPVTLADAGCARETFATDDHDGCYRADGDQPQFDYTLELPQDTLQEALASGEYTAQELDDYLSRQGARYNPHGTHVAGTMLANRDGKGIHGVAWGADLSPVRIFSHSYDSYLSDKGELQVDPGHEAYAAVFKQLREQNVRAINHSWGSPKVFQTLDELDAELERQRFGLGNTLAQGSRDAGFLQVWASNNTRTNNLSPETAPYADILTALPRVMPEIEKYWLSVVNVNDTLTLAPGSFRCGYSMNWCVAAPGTGIISTYIAGEVDVETLYQDDGEINGVQVTSDRPRFGYGIDTGTSMATPHVTGSLALLMERFPYLDNPQIRDVLLTTARDLGAPGVDDVYGWGLIDLKKAIDGPGQLRVDTDVIMDRRAGGAKVWQGDAWDDWRNDISGPGRLGKSGAGWLRLSGNNSFAGATLNGGTLELDGNNRFSRDVNVEGGLLRLNGTLLATDLNINGGIAQISGQQIGANTYVGPGGLLSGDGELSSTRVLGTIVPGSERRAMTVNGDYSQGHGSLLIASAGRQPHTPALHITGQAQLDGGTLRVNRQPAVFPLGQHYRVLQADAGVNGQFSALDHSSFSPFLSFTQTRDDTALGINVGRGLPLVAAARTANQHATARGADMLDMSQPVAQRLTSLFPDAATRALDQLSGELHAGTRSVQIENTRVLRDAALAHARGALDSPARQTDNSRQGVWLQPLLQSGRLDGDGNAASVSHTLTGLLVGADHDFEQGSRAGVLWSSGQSRIKTARGDRANLDGYQIGMHAGHTWNAFGLYGGLAYGQDRIKTSRYVSFPGLDEKLSADYHGRTRQAFVEGNYRVLQGAWNWQPFVQFARVNSQTDGFRERTAKSALQGRAASSTVNLATGGLRFKVDLNRTSTGPFGVSLNGSAAYTRASGDLNPTTNVAWQDASNMRIAGAPLSKTALQLNLGAVARLNRSSSVSLDLKNQRGERSNGRSVSIQYQFEF